MNISISEAILPPPNLGTVPFDHDKFLQFAESNTGDSVASGNAYYQTVDPLNLRTTINDWKTLNGFIEPLPNTTAGLAAMGIAHALYRNATDLGFIRNIYIRVKANGDVVALLENYPSFKRTKNQSADETANGCSVPFDQALPKEQRCTSGGIDGFEKRDLSGVLASVVMEYSAVKEGGPKFTQFYGYGNDGARVSALDLTGRKKEEAFPGLCAVCHGGNPGIDEPGNFVPPDLAYEGAEDGNFGAGFLPFDPDLYEFHDPDGTGGAAVGSGDYSRANQEAFFKKLNELVLQTNSTPATRELVEGWYGGPGLPGNFDGSFVPDGWMSSPQDTTFYETVIAPYCRACHIQRAFPESTGNLNARDSRMDFNEKFDISGLRNQIATTVFTRTTMPLALVTYDKFWSDTEAVTNFINYLGSYDSQLIPTEGDGFGNLVAVMPGKPVAIPGAYIDQVVDSPLVLDGSQSLSVDTYAWAVSPVNGVTLTDATTVAPTFIASIPGIYTITLTVTSNEKADTSVPVSVSINVVDSPFSRITFDSSIKNSPTNARCLKCHSQPDAAGHEEYNLYGDYLKMSQLQRYSYVQGNFISRLLYKPAGLLPDIIVRDGVHKGGGILSEDDDYYALLKNWIEDGECKSETGCQRINVTNENTSLEIDPLSPFIDKSLFVSLTGVTPANGTLSITSEKQLVYIPKSSFSGLDSYQYLLMDLQTGSTRLVTDKVYVFPDLGRIPFDLRKTFSSQFSDIIPDIGSSYEFEKVNTDGDTMPNYLDDYPNNPLISRDHDGDGLPDAFNTNISAAQSSTSGIVKDADDDNDGTLDVNDDFPLDSTKSAYSDRDRDGVEDASDPYPFDMLGTIFEGFESGNLSTLPWATSGNGSWHIESPPEIAGGSAPLALLGRFSVKTPILNDNESAGLTINLTIASGHLSFWYLLSSEGCCDNLIFSIDSVVQSNMNQTSDWTKASFPVTAGNHAFTWVYSKDGSISSGLDAAWVDAIEFSGPLDSDFDGASNALDNCPLINNTSQSDLDADGLGDACDTGDFDNDGITDAVEITLGTNLADSDSDQDGAMDGVDLYPRDPAASIDTDGDGSPDVLVPGVASTSLPPLTVDLEPLNSEGGLDLDGDGIGDNAIYTIAGAGVVDFIHDGGPATAVNLNGPSGLTFDASGNLYIAESGFFSNRVRRVDALGIITTVAGVGFLGFSGDGGLATAAQLRLRRQSDLAIDTSDNLYIADAGNNRVRRVDAVTGIITTVAGTGIPGFSGDGGLATAANLSSLSGLAIDTSGNLYIADAGNARVRRVDTVTGIITTVVGTGIPGFSGDGGLATAANLSGPSGLTIDTSGNIYIADTGNARVRRVDAVTGIITTVVGTGTPGFNGDGGLATAANLSDPSGIALDTSGNLYIADTGNARVRWVDAVTGIITTVVGTGIPGFSGDGGLATAANLHGPSGLAIDTSGNLYITGTGNDRVRRVDAVTGIITTAAGGGAGFFGDGVLATEANLSAPSDLAIDTSGNLYIEDNARVRRVDAVTGIITTVAGTGIFGFSGDGGLATAANLSSLSGLAIDTSGNLYIADAGNARVRRVDAVTGIITTVAGSGTSGFSGDGGLATAANLSGPSGLTIDTSGNLYIEGNARVRRADAVTGIITTVAGTGTFGFSGDGGLATAANLSGPSDLAIDTSGNLYIADAGNNRVRRVDAVTGIIMTVAGGVSNFDGDSGFYGDSVLATEANLNYPSGLAIDTLGNLYIADAGNARVRRVDTVTGIITTVAGGGVCDNDNGCFSGDGGLATAANLSGPSGLTIDTSGSLYIADSSNDRIRQVTLLSTSDAFPNNPAASIDTDGDGFPDWFNINATIAQIEASGLIIDAFPNDPSASIDTDGDGLPDHFIMGVNSISVTPLTQDFDDDGDSVNDVDEIIAGTNHLLADTDGDGVNDGIDVFPLDISEHQDTDGDGIGNNADAFPNDATEILDLDKDGIGNNADTDDDNDGLPDTYESVRGLDSLSAADINFDLDGDGYNNIIEYVLGFELNNPNAFPAISLLGADSDGDGIPDADDTFPLDVTEFIDSDGDGVGNNADTDDDNDGTMDSLDEMPLDDSTTKDTDGDGIGDNNDAFQNDPSAATDTDGDGLPDHFIVGVNATSSTTLIEDFDDDGDGKNDTIDNCPIEANSSQADKDSDGIGDACDSDDGSQNSSAPDSSGSVDGGGGGVISLFEMLAWLFLFTFMQLKAKRS